MRQTDLKPLALEGFSIKPSLTASSMMFEFTGSADMDARIGFSQFVTDAHAEAERLHVTEVILDVHELQFINSVCLKSLIKWLDFVLNMPSHRRYTLQFLVNPRLRWQDRSISALQRMAPSSVQITNWKGE